MSVRKTAVGAALSFDSRLVPLGDRSDFPSGLSKTRAAVAALSFDPSDDSSDDHCSYCTLGGEVVVCELSGCRRVYHTSCLGFSPIRALSFICPAHFCALCGQADRKLCASDIELIRCSTCPSSYCSLHIPNAGVAAATSANASSIANLPDATCMLLLDADEPTRTERKTGQVKPPFCIAEVGDDAAAEINTPVVEESHTHGMIGSSEMKRKRVRRTERECLLKEVLAAPTIDVRAPAEDISRAPAGSLSTRQTVAASSGRGNRFKCPSCIGSRGSAQFARMLEACWSRVVNVSYASVSFCFMRPVTDSNAVPIYLGAGLTPQALGLPRDFAYSIDGEPHSIGHGDGIASIIDASVPASVSSGCFDVPFPRVG
jgi:hypothetical protein